MLDFEVQNVGNNNPKLSTSQTIKKYLVSPNLPIPGNKGEINVKGLY